MNFIANLLKALAQGLAALSPNCKQVSRLQAEMLEHELPVLQRVGLRIHLLLCHWCRRYGKQIRSLRDATREHPDQLANLANQNLADAARERMKQRLRANQTQEPPPGRDRPRSGT